jgi:hypothetical protein
MSLAKREQDAERYLRVIRRARILVRAAKETGTMRIPVGPGPDIREYRPTPSDWLNEATLESAALSFADRLTP